MAEQVEKKDSMLSGTSAPFEVGRFGVPHQSSEKPRARKGILLKERDSLGAMPGVCGRFCLTRIRPKCLGLMIRSTQVGLTKQMAGDTPPLTTTIGPHSQ